MLGVGRVCRGCSGGIVDGPWLPTKEIGLFSEKIGLVTAVELLLLLKILGCQRNSFFGGSSWSFFLKKNVFCLFVW